MLWPAQRKFRAHYYNVNSLTPHAIRLTLIDRRSDKVRAGGTAGTSAHVHGHIPIMDLYDVPMTTPGGCHTYAHVFAVVR